MPPIRAIPKSLALEYEGALRGRFYSRVPPEHGPEAVGAPAYFGDEITKLKLREGDRIEVEPEDMSWMGELVVRAIVPTSREVVTRWVVGPVFFDVPAIDAGDFTVQYRGKANRHCIYNGDQLIEGGFATKEMAQRRLEAIRAEAMAA